MTYQSAILAFSTMILVSGCQFAAPGDRASLNTCATPPCEVVCPEGETCSPDTPNGLFFGSDSLVGTLFGGGGPHPIAEGGTQTISVFRDANGTKPFSPFTADAEAPLEIAEVEAPSVKVRGAAAGSGFLRILDPDDGALHDRISLQVLPISSVRVTDATMAVLDAEGAQKDELALFAGTNVELGLLLFGEAPNGQGPVQLVDDSTTIVITGDATDSGEVSSWDRRRVTVGASGSVNVSVKAGAGEPVDVTFPVVSEIDDIVATKSLFSTDLTQPLTVGKANSVCFRGLSGARVVAGLSWAYSGDTKIEVEPVDAMCASFKPLAAGNASIVVEAGGLQKTFPVTIVAAVKGEAPAEKAPSPGEVRPEFTPGERAGL
ncbi:hypothetical protein [Polyangium spumosum]|uniref:Uncharacterized protein n=1 Tax=Polyangium spumosum TaxID=889282 RepID=A0A6N7PGK0_9BACT|nr:hypothetical protein [Polyangium spumosum]MRG91129.1 hypothetical protein [Polyangium spumosum]